MLISIGSILLLSLLGYWGFLYAVQQTLLYPGTRLRGGSNRLVWPNAKKLTLSRPDGPVYAWLLQPFRSASEAPSPLLVFFHGNYELAQDQAYLAQEYLERGWAVLLPEYRGFGDSCGRPNQIAIRQDAIEFLRQAAQVQNIDLKRVVYHGRSLGGAVACDLSLEEKPRAMILESTFLSGPAMANHYFAPGFVMKNPYRSDLAVTAFDGPILLIHGRDDRTIPFSQGQKLAAVAKQGTLLDLPGDHNDIPGDQAQQEQYWQAIDRLLDQVKSE